MFTEPINRKKDIGKARGNLSRCARVALYAVGIFPVQAASLEVQPLTIGSNLQVATSIKLSEPAPDGGIEITVTSEAPGRLRFSRRPDTPGTDSIRLSVQAGLRESPEVWVQAMSSGEEIRYSASAPGYGSSAGIVALCPSVVLLSGPYLGSRFPTTTGAAASRIQIYTARLDGAMQVAERQLISGGLNVEVELTSSNASVGKFKELRVTLAGGASGATTEFQPSGPGSTELSVSVPAGFIRPPDNVASITADVALPGIGIPDEVVVGQNLQIASSVGLGEAAPSGGVEVTLRSEDPERLLLSNTATTVGKGTIVVKIPEHGVSAQFYLQALGKSGRVGYSASALGHRTRAGKVILAPSGVVIAPRPYGPPDEAELFRKGTEEGARGFVSHLGKQAKMPLAVWTAQLDPVTLRSADITVQPLRGGLSLEVEVAVSDPALGRVISPVKIDGGSEHGSSEFTPLAKGEVILTAITPDGFTRSANSTTVSALVKD